MNWIKFEQDYKAGRSYQIPQICLVVVLKINVSKSCKIEGLNERIFRPQNAYYYEHKGAPTPWWSTVMAYDHAITATYSIYIIARAMFWAPFQNAVNTVFTLGSSTVLWYRSA